METLEIIPITGVDAVLMWWPDIAPHIELALTEGCGELVLEDVKDALLGGKMHAFGIRLDARHMATVVTEIAQHPRKRTLRVILAGGLGLRYWLPSVVDYLAQCGERAGCDLIELHGRPGWSRLLKNVQPRASVLLIAPLPFGGKSNVPYS